MPRINTRGIFLVKISVRAKKKNKDFKHLSCTKKMFDKLLSKALNTLPFDKKQKS